MNSRYEWTVLRETTSFYGVMRNQDGDIAVRITVSASLALVGADRQIGVWCIRRRLVRLDATAS